MAAVFISHSSADRAAAEALAADLRRRGCHSLFLDSDPEGGIGVGRRWEDTLYQELGACQVVVVLCSPAALKSRWVFAEITHARSLGKPLLPARIAPGEPPPILADTQILDLSAGDEAGYERLWEALQHAGIGQGTALAPERPPYPGLAGFRAGDAAVFFGRDALVKDVVEELERLRREGGAQLLLLAGAAGAGRASLLRAGVAPALTRRQGDWLVVGPFRPRGDAMTPLRRAVAGSDGSLDVNGGSAASFAGALRHACDRPHATVVLAIESLESLLAPVEQAALSERSDPGLTAWLRTALGSGDESLLCVATLRADQRGDLEDSELGSLPAVEIDVPPPDRRSLPEIISRPALAARGEVSAELVVSLVEALRGDAGLPDLAAALHRLWKESDGGELTLERYHSLIGDLAGHIDRSAERALDLEHHGEDEVKALRQALRSLVRVGAEGHLLPTVIDAERLPETTRPLLERLVTAGLMMRVDGEPGTDPALALAHVAVTERWRRLRQWLNEDLEFLRWRRRFAAPVAAWQARGERLGTRALTEAERWVHAHPEEVSGDGLALIRRSRAALRRRTLAVVATTALVIVALAGLSLFALHQRGAAETRLAAAHRIAAVDQRDRVGDLLLAAHHFARVARLSSSDTLANSARQALGFLTGGVRLDGIDALGEEALGAGRTVAREILVWGAGQVLVGSATGVQRHPLPPGEIPLALMRSDGEHLISRRGPRELRLTALRSGSPGPGLTLPGTLVSARPDHAGRSVLAWTENGQLLRWNPEESPALVLAHGGVVRGVVEAGKAGALVSFGSEPAARYWPAHGGEPHTLDLPHDVYAVAAGPTGRVVLVTGGRTLITWEPPHGPVREIALQRPMDQVRPLAEGGFLLWDGDGVIWRLTAGGDGLEALHRHGDALTCVERSPGGRLLATCGLERDVRIWDFGAGDSPRSRPGPCKACSARFAPDGETLLTWDDGGRLQRWDVETGQALGLPMRHDGPVGGAFFADEGRTLWSWSRDGQLRRWTLPDVSVPKLSVSERSAPLAVAASGADAALVYANRLGQICRWSGQTRSSPACRPLQGLPEPRLNEAVLSPDGALLAAWRGSTARVWRSVDGALVEALGAGPGRPAFPGARFSANGQRLLLWGENGRSRLWDAGQALELPELVHPGVAIAGDLGIDGRRTLLRLADGLARVWETPTGVPPPRWDEPQVLAYGVLPGALLGAGGRLALAWRDPGVLERWSLETATPLEPVALPALGDIAGATRAAGSERILLWSGATAMTLENDEVGPALNHGVAVHGAILRGDGTVAVTWDDFDARVWEPRSGTPVTPALAHPGRIRGVILAEDGGWMLLWSSGSLRRWPLTPDRVDGDPVEWLERVSGTRLAEGTGSTNWQLELLSPQEWMARREGN